MSPVTLRDLRGRVHAARRGEGAVLRGTAPVGVLCAGPALYERAAIEAGAALVGLRTVTYGPEEVARLGEPAVAGERLGALHTALVGVGFPAATLAALAERSAAPVVEGGGPGGDPAGALADLLVLERALGGLTGRTLAWVGDTCGLLSDLLVGGCTFGLSVSVAHPVGFAPDLERVTWARERAALSGAAVLATTDLAEAVRDASALYVEAWPEAAAERFRPYAVQRHLLRGARGGCVILHRRPEARGPEISPSLAEESGWLALEQSRARADAWAGVLAFLLEPDPLRSVLRGSR